MFVDEGQKDKHTQGRLIFVAFLYAIIYLFSCCVDFTWKYCQSRSYRWLVHSAGSILLGGKVYFGLRPFSLLYLSLSLVARLHTNTTADCSSPVSFLSSSCSCWKILSGWTPSLGQTSKLLHDFSVNAKCSCTSNSMSYTSHSNLFSYVDLKLFSCCIELKVFHSTLSEFTQLCERVLLFCILSSWKVPSVVLSSMHTPWRVPLFCTLHSIQERHCILYQESTQLCRLWTLYCSATLKYCCEYYNPVIMPA